MYQINLKIGIVLLTLFRYKKYAIRILIKNISNFRHMDGSRNIVFCDFGGSALQDPLGRCFPLSTSLDKSDIPVTPAKNKTREREYVSRICVSRVLVGFILAGDIPLSARRYRASPGSKTFRPYADKP